MEACGDKIEVLKYFALTSWGLGKSMRPRKWNLRCPNGRGFSRWVFSVRLACKSSLLWRNVKDYVSKSFKTQSKLPANLVHWIVNMINHIRHNTNRSHQSIWFLLSPTIIQRILNHWNVIKQSQICTCLRHFCGEDCKLFCNVVVAIVGLHRREKFCRVA